jgi:hypothetical protein
VGTLCVLDKKPGTMEEAQKTKLQSFALQVQEMLQQRIDKTRASATTIEQSIEEPIEDHEPPPSKMTHELLHSHAPDQPPTPAPLHTHRHPSANTHIQPTTEAHTQAPAHNSLSLFQPGLKRRKCDDSQDLSYAEYARSKTRSLTTVSLTSVLKEGGEGAAANSAHACAPQALSGDGSMRAYSSADPPAPHSLSSCSSLLS